jgi:lysophospholipase L1-like esterase
MGSVAGKKVVILGDSHVDGSTFGKALEGLLVASGANVTRYGWGGSAARTWLAGKPIFGKQFSATQVRDAGPWDIAIISLGTNDGANGGKAAQGNAAQAQQFAKQAAAQIKEIADTIGASETWWAEPPQMSPSNAYKGGDSVPWYTPENIDLVRVEGRKLFGGNAIDATSVGTPDGDGIHLGGQGGKAWAALVHQRVLDGSHASFGSVLWAVPVALAIVGAALLIRNRGDIRGLLLGD